MDTKIIQKDDTGHTTLSITPPKPTALRVAQLRAVHQIMDKPLIFDDPFACKILGDTCLQDDLTRFHEPLYRGLRTSIVVRSRLSEDEWRKSYLLGLRQYVVLGAGLDTFAYRYGHLDGIQIFEVDLPSTQAWKNEHLRTAEIKPPSSLIIVPADFETFTLHSRLEDAGFQTDSPAFFSWLGVTMYIEEESIDVTLQFIASCARQSIVLFDYCVDPSLLSPRELIGHEIISKKVAEQGEPWKTFYSPEVMVQMLHSLGFSKVQDFGTEELNRLYLAGRTDGLKKSGVTRLIRAEK